MHYVGLFCLLVCEIALLAISSFLIWLACKNPKEIGLIDKDT